MTSLRLRLLGIIGASLLLLWTLVAVWMFIDLRSQMRAALDDRLAASARMVAALVAQLPATPGPARALAGPLVDVIARDGLACEVSLLRGEVMLETVARTASSPGMADVAPGYSTRTFGGKLWRTYVLQQGGIRVATADRLDVREGLMRDIGLAAGVPFAVALAGSLLLLWFAIGRGLAPIEAIRRQLARRRPDDDAALPATAVPAELSPLVDTIGQLLERVRGVIARERRFTDDAAHELRTPLTAVKTHLQVMGLALARDPAGPAVAQAVAHASEGVLRMQRRPGESRRGGGGCVRCGQPGGAGRGGRQRQSRPGAAGWSGPPDGRGSAADAVGLRTAQPAGQRVALCARWQPGGAGNRTGWRPPGEVHGSRPRPGNDAGRMRPGGGTLLAPQQDAARQRAGLVHRQHHRHALPGRNPVGSTTWRRAAGAADAAWPGDMKKKPLDGALLLRCGLPHRRSPPPQPSAPGMGLAGVPLWLAPGVTSFSARL